MSGLSKIVPLLSCLYLFSIAIRLPQIAAHDDGKHQVLTTVIVSGLTAVALFGIGVFLLLIIS
jgi:hypothetical protein